MRTRAAEAEAAHAFCAEHFSKDGAVPFSFGWNGRPFEAALPTWQREATESRTASGDKARTLRCIDPASGLHVRLEAVEYDGLPVVEWVVHLRNTGSRDTPIIDQLQAMDVVLPCPEACTVAYSLGALCSVDDFAPVERRLRRGSRMRLTPGGGRSSSEVLPFFNVDRGTDGIVAAIGWTGEWAMELARASDGGLRVRAGMDRTHLSLHPGEEIRTPRILLVFWEGDRLRGHNMLRRYILDQRPTVQGKPLVVPSFVGTWGATPASIHLGNIARLEEKRVGAEFYWIDAGWFGSGPWHQAPGTWKPNADLYPGGMGEIGSAVHAGGRRLLVWFEPQRVSRGSAWAREHPEWLLRIPAEDEVTSWPGWDDVEDPAWRFAESKRNRIAEGDALLDIGNPQARSFLTDFLSRCIEEFGLDCYREDFNIAPLAFWRRADGPDRQGMTEIRWIEGLYAMWDELRARHPGLMIDNCASGGRRIDIETLRRATPLWRTDAPGNPEARQCHTWGLSLWVPLHATGGLGDLTAASDYELRSSLAAGLIFSFWNRGDTPQPHPFPADLDWERARGHLAVFERLRRYYYGEFYPLSEYSLALDSWLAMQFHRPDLDEGMVIVFKRPRSTIREAVYPLHGLDREATYEVRDEDTGSVAVLGGGEIADPGLTVRLEGRPGSALLVYRRCRG